MTHYAPAQGRVRSSLDANGCTAGGDGVAEHAHAALGDVLALHPRIEPAAVGAAEHADARLRHAAEGIACTPVRCPHNVRGGRAVHYRAGR